MTPERASKNAANHLILAYKELQTSDEVRDHDSSEPYYSRRALSGRFFVLNAVCLNAVQNASLKLRDVIGTYPRENARDTILDIVIAVRDKETPLAKAHQELRQEVRRWLDEISHHGEWEVLHAVRGVQTYKEPFKIGHCTFFRMDEQTFYLWGRRFATGKYDPPSDAPLHRSWIDQDSALVGQAIALAGVRAYDSAHARSEGRRIINESLDLLRYGQVTVGWPPEPVPEFGLAALAAHGYVQTQAICVRRDKPAMTSNKSIGAGDGAAITYCQGAPAWQEIEHILLLEPQKRSEMQRRVMLALSWVGQAALASSMPVRLVAFTTAMETLLIEDSECVGKKKKLSVRVPAFPQMKLANQHVDSDAVIKLYGLRSDCLHAGQMEVESEDVGLASLAVAQCFSGLLGQPEYAACLTIGELLAKISPDSTPST